jgi:hypothetical protein
MLEGRRKKKRRGGGSLSVGEMKADIGGDGKSDCVTRRGVALDDRKKSRTNWGSPPPSTFTRRRSHAIGNKGGCQEIFFYFVDEFASFNKNVFQCTWCAAAPPSSIRLSASADMCRLAGE